MNLFPESYVEENEKLNTIITTAKLLGYIRKEQSKFFHQWHKHGEGQFIIDINCNQSEIEVRFEMFNLYKTITITETKRERINFFLNYFLEEL